MGTRIQSIFHALASHYRRCNFIEELWVNNAKIRSNINMREAASDFFSELYKEEFPLRPKLNGLNFKKLSENSWVWIEYDFTDEEIFEALKRCNGDKAPETDGFNLNFLQEFWHVVKDDILEMFMEFHRTGKFVRSLNSTFLVLIVKKRGAIDIRDFRPISLVGCIYKLLAKVLTRRLSTVLGEVIGECQHAFVEGRLIHDAVLIVNKVVDELVADGRVGLLCKLGMEKPYDRVSGISLNICWRDWVLA